MQKRHFLSLSLLCCVTGLASAALAHPEYRVTIMAPANSEAIDINDAGVVVGTYPRTATVSRAFLNRGRGLVDMGERRGIGSRPVAINDKGQVLGHWIAPDNRRYGFVYYCGRIVDIASKRGWGMTFTDINNHGYITAYGSMLDSFAAPHGFLRAPNGSYRDIGSVPAENPLTVPLALNNRNQITGESGPLVFPDQPLRAFLWTSGVMRDLGDFGLDPNGGNAINDRGQVTGYAALPEGLHDRHAFIFTHGRLIDIDTSAIPFERFSYGTGINNHGHIVGTSQQLSGFIYRGRRMQSLNQLVDPKLGWQISYPKAVNDAGQIVATAYRNGVQYAVRLDLIRPHGLAAPDLGGAVGRSTGTATAAEVKAQSEALSREVVQPVQQ